MSHPDPRPPAADGERDLPEEIERAIDAYGSAEADSYNLSLISRKRVLAARRAAEARSALTTSILSRLTAAEAGREEAEKELNALRRVHRWNVEHLDGEVLVCRNNHDRGEDCDWERFVPEERLTDAEAERDEALRISAEALALVPKHAVEAAKAEIHRDVAVAERDAALARVEKLEKALAPFAKMAEPVLVEKPSWATPDAYAFRIHPGAVAVTFGDFFRAHDALTEAQPKGDQ